MKRHPLEEKIFSNQKLSSAERRSLKKAVTKDPELANLYEGWLGVEAQLSTAEISSPKPGFKQRWLERHQAEVLQTERIHAAWLTFLSSSAALALLVMLLQRIIPSFDALKQLLFGFMNGLAEFVAFVQIVINVSLSLLQKLPPSIWASVGALIIALPLIWIVVFRELAFTKGDYK
jgi:hypothetical protein